MLRNRFTQQVLTHLKTCFLLVINLVASEGSRPEHGNMDPRSSVEGCRMVSEGWGKRTKFDVWTCLDQISLGLPPES